MNADTTAITILATRNSRRATALCAEPHTGCASSSSQPAAWRQLAKADERGEVFEGLLRITLAGVLISTLLTGILL